MAASAVVLLLAEGPWCPWGPMMEESSTLPAAAGTNVEEEDTDIVAAAAAAAAEAAVGIVAPVGFAEVPDWNQKRHRRLNGMDCLRTSRRWSLSSSWRETGLMIRVLKIIA